MDKKIIQKADKYLPRNNKQNITLTTPSQWFKIGDYYKELNSCL